MAAAAADGGGGDSDGGDSGDCSEEEEDENGDGLPAAKVRGTRSARTAGGRGRAPPAMSTCAAGQHASLQQQQQQQQGLVQHLQQHQGQQHVSAAATAHLPPQVQLQLQQHLQQQQLQQIQQQLQQQLANRGHIPGQPGGAVQAPPGGFLLVPGGLVLGGQRVGVVHQINPAAAGGVAGWYGASTPYANMPVSAAALAAAAAGGGGGVMLPTSGGAVVGGGGGPMSQGLNLIAPGQGLVLSGPPGAQHAMRAIAPALPQHQQQQAAAVAVATHPAASAPGAAGGVVGKPAPQPTLAQAVLLQQTIRGLKEDIPLVQNLSTLAAMAPEQLLQVLVSTKVNIVEVLSKLTGCMEPGKAAEVWQSFDASGGGAASVAAGGGGAGPSDVQQQQQQRAGALGGAGGVMGNGNNAPARGQGGQPRGLMLGGPLPPSTGVRAGGGGGTGPQKGVGGALAASNGGKAAAAAAFHGEGPAHSQQPRPAAAAAGSGEEASGGQPVGIMNQELLDQCTKRLKPGTVKHSVFVVLRDEAGANGMAVADIYAAMQKRGMGSQWSDPRAAKSSIASSCAHDPAFVRIKQGVFALRACLSQSMLDSLAPAAPAGGGGGGRSGGGGSSAAGAARGQGAAGRGGGAGTGRRAAAAGVAAAAAAAAGSPASSGASPAPSSPSSSESFGGGEADEAELGAIVSGRIRRGSFTGGSEERGDGDDPEAMEGVEGPGGKAALGRPPGLQLQLLPKPPGPTVGLPAQNQPLAPGHSNPVHAFLRREAFARNTHKCGICHKTYHPTYSPLVLCDFCPRAHHVYCLDLDWKDLPQHEWACPKCLSAPAQRASKGMQYEQRKMDAQERYEQDIGGCWQGLLGPREIGWLSGRQLAAWNVLNTGLCECRECKREVMSPNTIPVVVVGQGKSVGHRFFYFVLCGLFLSEALPMSRCTMTAVRQGDTHVGLLFLYVHVKRKACAFPYPEVCV